MLQVNQAASGSLHVNQETHSAVCSKHPPARCLILFRKCLFVCYEIMLQHNKSSVRNSMHCRPPAEHEPIFYRTWTLHWQYVKLGACCNCSGCTITHPRMYSWQ